MWRNEPWKTWASWMATRTWGTMWPGLRRKSRKRWSRCCASPRSSSRRSRNSTRWSRARYPASLRASMKWHSRRAGSISHCSHAWAPRCGNTNSCWTLFNRRPLCVSITCSPCLFPRILPLERLWLPSKVNSGCFTGCMDRLIDWLIGLFFWLMQRMSGWLIDWLNGYLQVRYCQRLEGESARDLHVSHQSPQQSKISRNDGAFSGRSRTDDGGHHH